MLPNDMMLTYLPCCTLTRYNIILKRCFHYYYGFVLNPFETIIGCSERTWNLRFPTSTGTPIRALLTGFKSFVPDIFMRGSYRRSPY